jgi:hypothetical protein
VKWSEYEKRLAIAIRLLGEEAGRRYMEQRLRELRGAIEAQLRQEVKHRLEGVTSLIPLEFSLSIGSTGVTIQRLRRGRTPAAGGEETT